MASPVIDKYCVRITIWDEHNPQIRQGSGTIIKKSHEYFVLTARHCLKTMEGKNAPLAKQENIRIERQHKYDSPFEQIAIEKIEEVNEEQDWALLKIKDLASSLSMADTNLGENPRTREFVFFRGYQGIHNSQPRSFDAKIIDTSNNEFKITLHESTFNQGGNLGADIARGLSGSGVFLLRNDKMYLIGHLKSVVGEICLNDDIKCAPVSNYKTFIQATSYNLESAENLPWSEDNRNLNDIFVRRIFEALREFNPAIGTVGKSVDEKPGLWDNQQFKGNVQKAVADKYFGVLGIQITKLICIGKSDKYNRQSQNEYLERINITAKRTAQLLTYICISKLWDCSDHENLKPHPSKKRLIENLFDNVVEPSLTDYFEIISFLVDLYTSNPDLESPFEELQGLHTKCQPGTYFERAFQTLQDISIKTDNNNFTLTDCFDAELQLATIFENLAFLSRYKMVSIKSARYQQLKKKKGNYQHYYLELVHSDKKALKEDEKLNYVSIAPSTDAVVFYTDSYEKGINLCPFIIDLTTLEADEGCQVYFYTSRTLLNKDILTYSTTATEADFTTDLECKHLPADVPAVIAVLMDSQKRIQLRKDMVHRLFMEARKELLGLWEKKNQTTKRDQ